VGALVLVLVHLVLVRADSVWPRAALGALEQALRRLGALRARPLRLAALADLEQALRPCPRLEEVEVDSVLAAHLQNLLRAQHRFRKHLARCVCQRLRMPTMLSLMMML
jgi:hypothetical protein